MYSQNRLNRNRIFSSSLRVFNMCRCATPRPAPPPRSNRSRAPSLPRSSASLFTPTYSHLTVHTCLFTPVCSYVRCATPRPAPPPRSSRSRAQSLLRSSAFSMGCAQRAERLRSSPPRWPPTTATTPWAPRLRNSSPPPPSSPSGRQSTRRDRKSPSLSLSRRIKTLRGQ